MLFRLLMIHMVFGVLGSLPSLSSADTNINFRFCYENKEMLPYYAGNNEEIPAEKPGLTIELLKLLNDRLPNVTITLKRYPWKRCLHELATGETSAVIGSHKIEREAFAVYPNINGEVDIQRAFNISSAYCLFSRHDNDLSWDGQRFYHFAHKTVAVPLGYSVASLFQNNKIDITQVTNTEKAIELLANKRVDAAATLCQSGSHYLQKYPRLSNEIRLIQPPLYQKGGYLIISKQFYQRYPAISEQIWQEVKILREQHYNRMLKTYEAYLR